MWGWCQLKCTQMDEVSQVGGHFYRPTSKQKLRYWWPKVQKRPFLSKNWVWGSRRDPYCCEVAKKGLLIWKNGVATVCSKLDSFMPFLLTSMRRPSNNGIEISYLPAVPVLIWCRNLSTYEEEADNIIFNYKYIRDIFNDSFWKVVMHCHYTKFAVHWLLYFGCAGD